MLLHDQNHKQSARHNHTAPTRDSHKQPLPDNIVLEQSIWNNHTHPGTHQSHPEPRQQLGTHSVAQTPTTNHWEASRFTQKPYRRLGSFTLHLETTTDILEASRFT